MPTLAPTELLNWLGQHQFLAPEQTSELLPQLGSFPDSHSFVKELMRRDWITAYQANQILQGKHDHLVLGVYRLRERIGEGAMGQVFKAWNLRLQRIVAVKTIHKQLVNSPKAMDRFRREVETASQLNHPNIAMVRDAGEEDGRPFLVMDFIEGVNLSQRVKQQGAVPIPEAVEYARQAALGLQQAYERGIVHRDIKPANLILLKARADGEAPLVKILDFGLARLESEEDDAERLTQVGKLLGTVDYVAPEQAQDARYADIRADIYSLGCCLFYMLTARPPFLGDTVLEKLGPRLTGDPPWVREVRPEVAPGLEAVLCKIMARRPEDRYQTPIEVAQALQPFASSAVSASVPMAMPAPSMEIADVPMAMPALFPVDAVAEPIEEANPAFLDMTATGRDMSPGGRDAARGAGEKKPIPRKVILWAGGAVLFVCVLGAVGIALAMFLGGAKKPVGELRITETKLSVPSNTLKPGDSKFILVFIKRSKFAGPVKVTLLDLPDGVRSQPKTIAANTDRCEVPITVSFGTPAMAHRIRVQAEYEAAELRAEVPLQLAIVERAN